MSRSSFISQLRQKMMKSSNIDNYNVFCSSVIGPANRERGYEKQDAVMLRRVRSGWLAVVCDGLGSRKKSAWGARQACRAVKSAIENITLWFDEQEFCELVQQFWLNYIKPEKATDASTTCIVAYIDDFGCFNIAQLGDGLVLCKSDGELHVVTPERQSFSDQTCAMSNELSVENWSFYEGEIKRAGDGIVLMTDGVSEDIDSQRFVDFFTTLYEDTYKLKRRTMSRNITQQLHDWPTQGHSDDKSLAGIFRIKS